MYVMRYVLDRMRYEIVLDQARGQHEPHHHEPPMSDYLSLPPEIVDNPQRSAIHDKKSIFQRV